MMRIRNTLMLLKYSFSTTNTPSSYQYPYNVNQEQHRPYLQAVHRQLELNTNPSHNPIPRRKRRVYDKPKYDDDIQHYGSWRLFGTDRMIMLGEEASPMAFKVLLRPRDLVHTFGIYSSPENFEKSSSGQYWFEDNSLSQYVLTEWRNTEAYIRNDPKWDYDNQENVEPRKRKVLRPSPQEFWLSNEEHEFRVYASKAAEHHKFKRWLLETIESKRESESYDSYIDKKFGKAKCYNTFEETGTGVIYPAAIEVITKAEFGPKKDEGKKKAKKGEKVEETVAPSTYKLPTRLGEEFRVDQTITVFRQQDLDKEEEEKKNAAKNVKNK